MEDVSDSHYQNPLYESTYYIILEMMFEHQGVSQSEPAVLEIE